MKLNLRNRISELLKSNWFVTLFATTLGILLALYLNNLNIKWNTEKEKNIAIENLELELSNNAEELSANETNDSLLVFLNKIKEINSDILSEFKASSRDINLIAKEYPHFIKIIDSTKIDEKQYTYAVAYEFEFALDDLQNVAWETSKMSNITNEFDYDCLNSLVRTYDLQQLYVVQQQKLLDYFINSEHNKLHQAISINQQLRIQLLNEIEETRIIIIKTAANNGYK